MKDKPPVKLDPSDGTPNLTLNNTLDKMGLSNIHKSASIEDKYFQKEPDSLKYSESKMVEILNSRLKH